MALIPTTVGYTSFVGIFVIICGLYIAKSWLHKKCKALLIENTSPKDPISASAIKTNGGNTENIDVVTQKPQPKNQQYFTSQIFPKSTLQLQIYVTTIDHYIAAIRTPLVQIAITVLLYTYIRSELVTNYESGDYVYNIVFHVAQLLALCTFYFVSNINPGIIRPHPAPNSQYNEIRDKNDEEQKTETSTLLNRDQPSTKSLPGGLERVIGGGRYQHIHKQRQQDDNTPAIEIECEWNNDSTVPMSYCYNCYFLHPIRAKHCYEIGFCVARYDHYCKLIENAVGANNLRYVILHLFLDSVVYVWQLCMVVYIMILNIGASDNDVAGWILIVFLCGYLLIASLTRTIHLFDHIQTISKNQTISEKVDPQRTVDVLNDGYHDYDDDEREIDYHDRYFDEGFFKNWFLCFAGYKENKEYFNGIKCKLMFDDDDDGTIFLQ